MKIFEIRDKCLSFCRKVSCILVVDQHQSYNIELIKYLHQKNPVKFAENLNYETYYVKDQEEILLLQNCCHRFIDRRKVKVELASIDLDVDLRVRQ